MPVLAALIPFSLAVAGDTGVSIRTIGAPFQALRIVGDALVISDEGRLGRIDRSGPDEVTNWVNTLTFRVGEVVRQQGGQSNEYWEILAITNGLAKMHHFGFAKGVDDIDETFWARESDSPKRIEPAPGVSSTPFLLTLEPQAGVTYEIGVYVVKQGDTLPAIARRHQVNAQHLRDLNPELAERALAVGQPIRVYEKVKD